MRLHGPLKNYLKTEVHAEQQSHSDADLDQLVLLQMIRWAYDKKLTKNNVVKSFYKAGLWRFNTEKLLYFAGPKYVAEPEVLVDAMNLTELYQETQESARCGDWLQPAVMLLGSVKSQQGLLFSGEEEMGIIKADEDIKRLKAKEKHQKKEVEVHTLEETSLAIHRARAYLKSRRWIVDPSSIARRPSCRALWKCALISPRNGRRTCLSSGHPMALNLKLLEFYPGIN